MEPVFLFAVYRQRTKVNKWPGGQWSVIERRGRWKWWLWVDIRHLLMMTQRSFQERMSNQTHRYMFLLALLDQIHPYMDHFYNPEAFVVAEREARCVEFYWFSPWAVISRPFLPADPVCRPKTGVQQAPFQDRPTLSLPLHLPVVHRQLQLRWTPPLSQPLILLSLLQHQR